jgi:hypothetical protein
VSAAIAGDTGKSLTTNFYSDVDNTGGGGFKSTLAAATINTFGGDITIRGGTEDATSGCGAAYSCIAGYASYGSSTGNAYGIYLLSSLNAAGGNISLYGRGNPTASTAGAGIYINYTGTVLSTSGTGTITLNGVSTGAERGIYFVSGNILAGSGLISMTATANATNAYAGFRLDGSTITSTGALSISGTGGNSENAVFIYGAGTISVAGDITINGQNDNRNWGVSIDLGKVLQTSAGNISITAVGTGGLYLNGSLVAGNDLTTPSSGGTIGINATGNSNYAFQQNTGSLISYGAISVTAVGSSAHTYYLHGTGAKVRSASDITISATSGTWGLTMYDNTLIQSTGGNIAITSNGTSGGLYLGTTGGIYASSNTGSPTATPNAGGTLTINATGVTYYGIQIAAGSLVSYGQMSISSTTSGLESLYLYGSGTVKSVGNFIFNGTTSGASQWGVYLNNSRIIQSTAGNISITSSSSAGHGIFINGGGLVAGNDTTTPGSGGSITINSTSGANNIDGAALRMDADSTKIIAWGDISIYANGAAAGLNVASQQGHGVIMWGSSQVIRSFNGALSITAYASQYYNGGSGLSVYAGGITVYSGSDLLQAKGNVTLNAVNMPGIALYLTAANDSGGGVISD